MSGRAMSCGDLDGESSPENSSPYRIDLELIPEVDRFAFWHDHGSLIYRPLQQSLIENHQLYVKAEILDIGPVVLGTMQASAQHYERTENMIKRDGVDHYHLIWLQKGTLTYEDSSLEVCCGPGDFMLLDSTRPCRSVWSQHQQILVNIPRSLIDGFGGCRVRPGRLAADSPAARLLGLHLSSLWLAAQSTDAINREILGSGLSALIKSYFSAFSLLHVGNEGQSVIQGIRQQVICDWIDRNLHAADLSVDNIASRFHLSRSSLYRLFQPWGGVKSYIHECRLRAARMRLKSTSMTDKSIAEVARELGFPSPSAFSHAFRKRWGFTPSRFINGSTQSSGDESSCHALKNLNCYDGFFAEIASLCNRYYQRQGISLVQSSCAITTSSHQP
jgi:AraC-like DNA-binding protein